MSQLAKIFGKQVKALRRERALSQAQLAEAVNLSEEWIRRIERGEGSPSLDTVEAIAGALGEAPSCLFGGSNGNMLPLPLARSLAALDDREMEWVVQAVDLLLARPTKGKN